MPRLNLLRYQDKLSKGKKVIKIGFEELEYSGEIDQDGNASGKGIAQNEKFTYEGIFEQDEIIMGIMIASWATYYGEFRQNTQYGKSTEIGARGYIINKIIVDNRKIKSQKTITESPEKSFYSQKGVPVRAVNAKWEDYI